MRVSLRAPRRVPQRRPRWVPTVATEVTPEPTPTPPPPSGYIITRNERPEPKHTDSHTRMTVRVRSTVRHDFLSRGFVVLPVSVTDTAEMWQWDEVAVSVAHGYAVSIASKVNATARDGHEAAVHPDLVPVRLAFDTSNVTKSADMAKLLREDDELLRVLLGV